MAGIDIGVHRSDRAPASASSTAKAPRTCAGRSMKPRWRPAGPAAPTTPTTSRSKPAASATPRLADDRAQARPPLLPRAARTRARRAGSRPAT
jgi:hypothetical protein